MKDGEEVTPDFFLVRKHRDMVTEDEERRIGMLAFLLSLTKRQLDPRPVSMWPEQQGSYQESQARRFFSVV
ncbi:unnamed protein product [Caenorhabditis auriculariae]|uniref:Uncharacterized protein n=1 Tax=Caenorhabditis auriculariae TaxID=2777116 RepID=A0A8S1HCW5_9PELO|nr:unnamed protein product [Caenorhabditis auriculariae]